MTSEDTKERTPMGSLTVQEWCEKHRITRQHFYDLKKRGLAPRHYRVGERIRISYDDDRAWMEAQIEAEAETPPSAA